MKLIYPAIFTPCEEKSGYTVEVPDLPGCVSEGDTLIEAIEMATTSLTFWFLIWIPIPKNIVPEVFGKT